MGENGSTSPCGRFFSFLHCIHPMLVSQRSALQPGRMWGGFCRFLSIGLSTHTPPPPICRELHNGTRISGLREVYYPRILLLLPSLFYPFPQTHIFSSYTWSTPLVWSTQNPVRTHNKGCCLIRCVPETSLVSRLCPPGLWLKWIRHLYWHIWTDRTLLVPVASVEKRTSEVRSRLSDSLLLHTMCTFNRV